MSVAEYDALDAVGLAALVRKGDVSPAELVETAIERIEKLESGPHPLGAVVIRAFEEGRALAARAPRDTPLAGVPFLLKDGGAPWAGVRLSEGSRVHENRVPARNGRLLDRHLADWVRYFGYCPDAIGCRADGPSGKSGPESAASAAAGT